LDVDFKPGEAMCNILQKEPDAVLLGLRKVRSDTPQILNRAQDEFLVRLLFQ
jgi:hypothetical protein